MDAGDLGRVRYRPCPGTHRHVRTGTGSTVAEAPAAEQDGLAKEGWLGLLGDSTFEPTPDDA